MKACSGRLRCHLVSAQILCRSGQGKRESADRNSCQEYERVLQRKQLRRNSDPWSTTTPAESCVFWRRGIPARASNWPSDASCYMRMRAAVFCALQRIRTQRSALTTLHDTSKRPEHRIHNPIASYFVFGTRCIQNMGFRYMYPFSLFRIHRPWGVYRQFVASWLGVSKFGLAGCFAIWPQLTPGQRKPTGLSPSTRGNENLRRPGSEYVSTPLTCPSLLLFMKR